MALYFPPLIFLLGPSGAGKTTLASQITQIDHRTAHMGFDEPIREATLSIFFPDQMHMGIDVRDGGVKKQNLPYSSITIGQWMDNLRRLLKGINPSILGDLAKKRSTFVFGRSYDRIVFDDLETPDELRPFVLSAGAHSCRLVFIERDGKPCTEQMKRFGDTFISKIVVRNPEGKPEEMLTQLKSAILRTPAGPSLGPGGYEVSLPPADENILPPETEIGAL